MSSEYISASVEHGAKRDGEEKPHASTGESSKITTNLMVEVEEEDSVIFPHQFKFVIASLRSIFRTLIFALPILMWFVFATLKFVFEELETTFANITSTKEFLQNQNEDEHEIGVKQEGEENISITTDAQRLKDENSDLTIKMQRLKEDNTEIATEVQQLQNENTDLMAKIQRNKEQNISITTEVQRLQNENLDLTIKIQRLQEENNEITTKVQKENADPITKIQRIEEEKTDLVIRMQHLEEENEEIKLENSNLKTINNLLQEDSGSVGLMALKPLVDLQLHGLEFFEKKNQLQQEISSLHSQNQELREENIRKNNEIQRHVDDNRKKSNDIRQLRLEKQQLQEEKSLMESQIQQLRQEKNDMVQQNEQLREANTRKNSEIQQHEENNSNLTNEIQQLREENDGMSNELRSLRQENNNMEIEIEQLHENTKSSIITECGTVTFSTDDKPLGRGGWATVYTGDFYGTKVAVKEFHEVILSPHNKEILKREINIASQCRHPNLLQMICATKNEKNCLLIVTELMDMALRKLLEQRANENSRLEPSQVKLISLDVARGLNYLHSKTPNPIIHRDVSSANVLLCTESGSVRRAKVSDYGSANFLEVCNTENPGAPLYAAPEAMGAQHSPKLDVYSYGILVCEIYNCKVPGQERRAAEIRRIKNNKIKTLVKNCTEMDPRKRPTMQDVIGYWRLVE